MVDNLEDFKMNEMDIDFLSETNELLESIENNLIALESKYCPKKYDATFRALHNIKGMSAMVGLQIISTLCHQAEDKVRSLQGKQFLSNDTDYILGKVDDIKKLLVMYEQAS